MKFNIKITQFVHYSSLAVLSFETVKHICHQFSLLPSNPGCTLFISFFILHLLVSVWAFQVDIVLRVVHWKYKILKNPSSSFFLFCYRTRKDDCRFAPLCWTRRWITAADHTLIRAALELIRLQSL